jgi:hypothetical protein
MFLPESEDSAAVVVGVPLLTRRLRKCLVRKSYGAYEVDTEVHGALTAGGDTVCKPPRTYPEKTVEYVVEELGLGSAAVVVVAVDRNAPGAGWTTCAWLVWAMWSISITLSGLVT